MNTSIGSIAAVLLLLLLATPSVANAQTTLDRRQPMFMTSYKWAGLKERQRDIYVRGFLETMSFILYGPRRDDEKQAALYSDWTACSEREPRSRWLTLDWMIRGETEKTVAAQFSDSAPTVCKAWIGKGDKSWRSVLLLKPAEWKALPLHERAIYLMAYVETVYAVTERTDDPRSAPNLRKLDICLASAGIEGLMSSMEQTKVEWQFPMPWSVSRALGATCQGRGD